MYKNIFFELREHFDYIVTVADHGEMLGEHGMWNHSYGLYPELVHVPLVISDEEIETERNETVVSLLDVHRTICELADIDVESRGQDLLDEPDGEDKLFEYHGFLHWHKEQFERKGVSPDIFKQRDSPLDGFVDKNRNYVYDTHDSGLTIEGTLSEADARASLNELISTIDRKEIQSSEPYDVDEDVQSQLEDLGYA